MGDSVRPVRATAYGDATSSYAPGLSSVRRSADAPDLLNRHIVIRLINISFTTNVFNSLRPNICGSKLTIIASDNGFSSERRQANIWTNAGILLIGTLGTNFSEILSEIHTFSFKKMHLKTSSACHGLNVWKRKTRNIIINQQHAVRKPLTCHWLAYRLLFRYKILQYSECNYQMVWSGVGLRWFDVSPYATISGAYFL